MNPQLDPNDPRLTAYALGELKLEGSELSEFENLLKQSPEAQKSVEEIRQTASWLEQELLKENCPELTPFQRNEVFEQAGGTKKILHFPWQRSWMQLGLTAVAACLLLSLGVHFLFFSGVVQEDKIQSLESRPASPPLEENFRDDLSQKNKTRSQRAQPSIMDLDGNEASSKDKEELDDKKVVGHKPQAAAFSQNKTTLKLSQDEGSASSPTPTTQETAMKGEEGQKGDLSVESFQGSGGGLISKKPSSQPVEQKPKEEALLGKQEARGNSEKADSPVSASRAEPSTPLPRKETERQRALSSPSGDQNDIAMDRLKNGVHFFSETKTESALPLEQAAPILIRAEVFGLDGQTDPRLNSQKRAYQQIIESSEAVSLLKKIFEQGNSSARMYALCGLRKLNSDLYAEFSKAFRKENPLISRVRRGASYSEPAVDILDRLEKGLEP